MPRAVLIAAYDISLSLSIRDQLKPTGAFSLYGCVTDDRMALAALNRQPYDLALIDHRLPLAAHTIDVASAVGAYPLLLVRADMPFAQRRALLETLGAKEDIGYDEITYRLEDLDSLLWH